MRLRKLSLLMIAFLASTAWADQVTLKNGDRVTGKIIKKDGASLSFKSDVFGVVTIPWESVTQVSSDDQLTVVLPDGKSVLGKLSTKEEKVEVATQTTQETMALAEVKAVRNAEEQKAYERLEHPGLLNLWTGYFDLGASLAHGNAKSDTLTTSLNAARVTKTDKTTAYFNQILSHSTVEGVSSTTAQAIRGGWAYNRNVSSRVFVNLFNDYEYDRFQNLDLRFVLGGGLGYNVIKNDQTRLDLLGGIAYNREKFNTPLTRNSAEAYWGNDFNHKFSKITSFNQSFRMFNNLTETGEYRINFDVGTVTNINKWLAWQLTVSDRYLSNPVPGRLKNDVLFTTGLRISFAR